MASASALRQALNPIPEENLQRINILLKEYDTLRSELLQRTAAGFALVGVVAAAASWSLSQRWEGHRLISGLAGLIIVCLLFFGSRFINTQIRRCAERVRRIDARINFLAQGHLFEWA